VTAIKRKNVLDTVADAGIREPKGYGTIVIIIAKSHVLPNIIVDVKVKQLLGVNRLRQNSVPWCLMLLYTAPHLFT
jgi:hypothetical protein